MVIHSLFDVLRDGYLTNHISINWNIVKSCDLIFLIISVLFVWIGLNKEFEFFIGLFILRWGVWEYFYNVFNISMTPGKRFLEISAWGGVGIAVVGFLFPLMYQRVFIKVYNSMILKSKKENFL